MFALFCLAWEAPGGSRPPGVPVFGGHGSEPSLRGGRAPLAERAATASAASLLTHETHEPLGRCDLGPWGALGMLMLVDDLALLSLIYFFLDLRPGTRKAWKTKA